MSLFSNHEPQLLERVPPSFDDESEESRIRDHCLSLALEWAKQQTVKDVSPDEIIQCALLFTGFLLGDDPEDDPDRR